MVGTVIWEAENEWSAHDVGRRHNVSRWEKPCLEGRQEFNISVSIKVELWSYSCIEEKGARTRIAETNEFDIGYLSATTSFPYCCVS